MKDINYGISDVIFGSDTMPSKTVKFGDGNTLISGVNWGEFGAGVCLVRNKSEEHQPFQKYEHGELAFHVNKSPELEKVYLVFDNARSIDALIAQLELAKLEISNEVKNETN